MTQPELAEELYLEQINRFNNCYVVQDKHLAAMDQFCQIMAAQGILRLCFREGMEKYAQEYAQHYVNIAANMKQRSELAVRKDLS